MLNRFQKSWFPLAILGLGIAVVTIGFLYELLYVGLPYPGNDVPIELLQNQASHQAVASRIEFLGGSTIATGLGLASLQVLVRWLHPPCPRDDNPRNPSSSHP
jgi:hypothetical protein